MLVKVKSKIVFDILTLDVTPVNLLLAITEIEAKFYN